MNEPTLTIEELDETWLEEFNVLDNDYKKFYADNITFIRYHCIYINELNEIVFIKENKTILGVPSIIQKEELIHIIKNNSVFNSIKYKLFSMAFFNLNIEPAHLKTFLKSKNKDIGSNFLQPITINNNTIDKSITMFHDISNLFILFKLDNNTKTNKHNITHKFGHNFNKKTKRNLFKDKPI
jgi:hypothetical protein